MGDRGVSSRLACVSGVVTRSLLEAKWLRFFALLNIAADYEPERFPDGMTEIGYLPDMYIHRSIYLEIKPTYRVFADEYRRPYGFVRTTGRSLLVSIGEPPGETVLVLCRRNNGSVGKQVITDGFTWGDKAGEPEMLQERYLASVANDIAPSSARMPTWIARAMDCSKLYRPPSE